MSDPTDPTPETQETAVEPEESAQPIPQQLEEVVAAAQKPRRQAELGPGPLKQKRNKRGRFQKQIGVAEKKRIACELLTAGCSYDEIAQKLGYAHRATALNLINQAIAEIPASSAAAARRMVVAGQLKIWKAHLPLACGEKKGVPPSPQSAEVVDRVARRLSSMFGLDQPRSLRVEMDRQIIELLDRLEKELPSDVYERVLAIAAGSDLGPAPGEDPQDPPDGSGSPPEDS